MASRSLNMVLLIGNLTRDPEIRYTSSGAAVCSFGIATNRSWKDADGEVREEAEFHNLVAWNKMAEICYQILAKGMKVFIRGELRTRSWEDDAGSTRYRTEIKINDMMLLDSKGKQGAGGGTVSEQSEEVAIEDVVADEVSANSAGSDDKPAAKKPTKKSSEKKPKKASDAGGVGDPLEDELPF